MAAVARIAAALACASPALPQAEEAWDLPPHVPRPGFLAQRPEIPDILLKDKRESFYLTGFPIIGYDDEEGATLGASLQLFNNGSRDDPFFRTAPFRARHTIAIAVASEGVFRGLVEGDYPYAFDSRWRVRWIGGYVTNPINNYFGFGDAAMGPLTYPGMPGVAFDDFGEYQDALDEVVGGRTYARYNRFESRELPFGMSFERDSVGGVLRPQIGFQVRHVEIRDYSGRVIDGVIQERTRLREDAEAGKISGFDGGWNNYLKLGLAYDTRDFERDPTSGVLAEIAGELGTRFLGSDHDYQLVTTSLAGFWSPFGNSPRLVLAARGLYSMHFGDMPFYGKSTLARTGFDINGLGGYRALRGYQRRRFVGDSAVLLGGEARWSFTETMLGTQHLRFMLAGFAESGRVHDGVRLEFADWRHVYGAGFRLVWNLSTTVSFDFAVGDESDIFYLELGHPF